MGSCAHTFTDEYGCVDRCDGEAYPETPYCALHEEFHPEVMELLREEISRLKEVSSTYHSDMVKAKEDLTALRKQIEEGKTK